MYEKKDLSKMMKIGIYFLSLFLLGIIGSYALSQTVSVFQDNSTRKLPIYCVERNAPVVSISFDAAWGNEDTAAILDILKTYNVKATFFMTGGWIKNYPDNVKDIAQAGHDLGNHSLNHKQMSQLSFAECENEILTVNDMITKLTKKTPFLFRPPYGDYNNTVLDACKNSNCYCIQWDVDSLDWKNYGVDSIVTTVLNHKHLGNGSIILMHNGAKYTKEALPKIIEGLQSKGYTIIPISKLIYKNNFTIDTEGRQHPQSPATAMPTHQVTPNE